MTRVLMISRCPPYPLHLGDRLIVFHLARELAAMGVQIDLLAFAEHPSDWSLMEQQHYTRYFHDVVLFDAQPRPLPELLRRAAIPAARFPQQAAHAFAPEMWREIERRLQRHPYDAVHLFGGVQVYEFKHALGELPTVITPYESYSLYTRRQLARGGGMKARVVNRLNHVAARSFEGWMFTPYDVITVVSDKDRDELLSLDPALNVQVIPNGVQLDRFSVRKSERKPGQLLFVGNYEYAPNLDAALWLAREVFPLIREQTPAAKLWLVGNAPPDELRALASDTVEVTGRVEDVRPYYNEAALFVCPLRMGAGIKNKVLEALASGCPVVATPLSVDGIRVVDGESALLGKSTAELAAQTARLLNDTALQAHLRDNGRRVIEQHYSWRTVAEAYRALYPPGEQPGL